MSASDQLARILDDINVVIDKKPQLDYPTCYVAACQALDCANSGSTTLLVEFSFGAARNLTAWRKAHPDLAQALWNGALGFSGGWDAWMARSGVALQEAV